MTAITIRDVPDETLKTLKVRAARAGKSLQAYALDLLARETSKPSLDEVATRLERETRTELGTTDVLEVIEDGRERR